MLADDLEAYIKWCSVPLQDMVRQVLENPKEVISEHVCPTLVEVMRQLQRNEYKSKRLRHLHAHLHARENREELSKFTAKLELQIVSLVSQMTKARNERANPPWIVMRSIDRLYHGNLSPIGRVWRESDCWWIALDCAVRCELSKVGDLSPPLPLKPDMKATRCLPNMH